MTDEPDAPAALPDHLLPRVRELLERYAVPDEEAARLLDEVAEEAAWRGGTIAAERDGRVLRAVERRCRAYREELRRRTLEAYRAAAGAGEDAGGNGEEDEP